MSRVQLSEQLKKLAANSKTGLDVNQLRVVIALERAVARLEHEPKLKNHLVFKGGFVLLKLIESSRFTRDLDAVALDIDQAKATNLAQEALERDLKDEVWFLDVKSETIPDQGEYGGLRLNAAFHIGAELPEPTKTKKLSRVHIDIGFGDEIPESARKSDVAMHSILGNTPISWHVYPLEFIFAEKLQTLLERGSLNSRAKDVYDLVEIFPRCSDFGNLKRAIQSVFTNRKTELPGSLARAVRQIDPSTLERSWSSVDLADTSTRFNDYWNRLLEVLKTIDKTERK